MLFGGGGQGFTSTASRGGSGGGSSFIDPSSLNPSLTGGTQSRNGVVTLSFIAAPVVTAFTGRAEETPRPNTATRDPSNRESRLGLRLTGLARRSNARS